jgi:hypothetical protein
MSTSLVVQARNRELARTINEEARRNPQSPYTGKFVGIANGQVCAVADDLDTLVQRLQEAGADARDTLCLEAGLDYDAVQEIRGLP